MMLRDHPLVGGPVEVRGAFELEITPAGVLPRRLPAWTRSQIPDVFMNTIVQMTSGVRVVFATDSPVVELQVHPRTIHTVGSPFLPPVFQLVVDGVVQPDAVALGGSAVHIDRLAGPDGITFEHGAAATLRWDGLGDGHKDLAIWFPTNATVEIQALRVADGAAVTSAAFAGRRWTHYGSSISHCVDVARPFDAWPAQVAASAGVELTSFGFGGQCQLDPFMGRVIRDHPADVISLKLGINLVNAGSMSQRTFTPAVHGLLDTIRDGQPTTPVLLVSPIYCPSCEAYPGPTVPGADGLFDIVRAPMAVRPFGLTLEWIRDALSFIVEARRAEGDENLHYLDGLSLFGAADEAMLYDRLHPSPGGYHLLGERFAAAAFGSGGALAG
jgi:hypothetical protein